MTGVLLNISLNLDLKHKNENKIMTKEEKDKLILSLKMIRDSFFGNYVPTKESQNEIYKIYRECLQKIKNCY